MTVSLSFLLVATLGLLCKADDTVQADDYVICTKKELLESSAVDQCTFINVVFEKLTKAEVQQIIRVLAMPQLDTLVLRDVGISEEQSESIMLGLAMTQTKLSLSFRENAFGINAARALFTAVKKGKLKELDLRSIKLGDDEVTLLAEALSDSNELRMLDLEACHISPVSMRKIASALTACPSLEQLFISHNPMGDEGAVAIADAIKGLQNHTALSNVVIRDESIGEIGRKALTDAAVEGYVNLWDQRRPTLRKAWHEDGAGFPKVRKPMNYDEL